MANLLSLRASCAVGKQGKVPSKAEIPIIQDTGQAPRNQGDPLHVTDGVTSYQVDRPRPLKLFILERVFSICAIVLFRKDHHADETFRMSFSQTKADFSSTAWDICKPRLAFISVCLSLASPGLIISLDYFKAGAYALTAIGTISSLGALTSATLMASSLRSQLSALPGSPRKTKPIAPVIR